jgi:isoprenylcysteine carboxyl methyltransferase (ICMT) family protein YpbQ
MLFANVPLLQSNLHDLATTLKNNLKVLLFFNVLWLLAARVAIRASDTFTKDLALTGVVYLLLAYPVIVIRELRHFLPLAIIVLPLAMTALEREPSTHPSR